MRPLQFSPSLVLGSKGAQRWVQAGSEDWHATHCKRCDARSSPFRPSPSQHHPPEDLGSMCRRYLFSQSSPRLPHKCLSLSFQPHKDREGADQQERGTLTFRECLNIMQLLPKKNLRKGSPWLILLCKACPAHARATVEYNRWRTLHITHLWNLWRFFVFIPRLVLQ